MYTYEELWALLNPKEDYDQLKGKCRILWNSFSIEKRQYIYCRIEEKKKRKEFVDYNPLFAIRKNSTLRPQILSFDEYYSLYANSVKGEVRRTMAQQQVHAQRQEIHHVTRLHHGLLQRQLHYRHRLKINSCKHKHSTYIAQAWHMLSRI